MSQFRKINLSREDLEKNPHQLSPKPVEPISNTHLIKQDQEEASEDNHEGQEKPENNSQDNITDAEEGKEIPPGEPANDTEEEKSDITDNTEPQDQESYDETGLDFSEWYFPEGTPRWINY